MRYVTGYVLKKSGYRNQIYCDEDGVELEKPFQIPSQGLGKHWLDKYGADLQNGFAAVEQHKIGIPRYYTERLKHKWDGIKELEHGPVTEQQEHFAYLQEMITRAKEIKRASLPEPDPARNAAAEKIRELRYKEYRRRKQL